MRDRRLIYAATFLRAVAVGLIGVLLGLYLAALELDAGAVGVVVAAGLAGAALATLLATLLADRLGRKRSLIVVSLLSAGGATAAALLPAHPLWMGLAAFVGMLNGMGRDRGASLVIEQAILPSTTSDAGRTQVFAWYNVLQDAGHAAGSLLAAVPALLVRSAGVDAVAAQRGAVLGYAALVLATGALYLWLSPQAEAQVPRAAWTLSPRTRAILVKISSLFFLDSLGGGFLTTALLSYFFFERFQVGAELIGLLFFLSRVANALSHLAASWLARRIGLVKTMVYTHIPSSLLLLTVAYAPSFEVAALLFLIRESLVEMDVPTRQSYVVAVVQPEERTAASGITSLVRIAAWAVAPSFAGYFMQGVSLVLPLFVAAALKIVYDLLLYRAFHRLKPPEER